MGLIKEIADLIGEYERIHANDREPYNIFEVLGVSNKEVIMCRFLTDLLNPAGEHNQGIRYLKIFLKEILGYDYLSDEEICHCRVYAEFPIDQERRIDIVIKSKKLFIPIEVKINAGEQESQCYDYYQYALKMDHTAKVVYLTKFGTQPSEYSTEKLVGEIRDKMPNDKIECISFSNSIKHWIEKILENEQSEMRQILEQFQCVIENMTGQPDKGMQMMIENEIVENEENFRAGLEIARVIDSAKAKLIIKVMREFEEQMKRLEKKYSLTKETKADWYGYEKNASEEFYRTYSTYPGLNYTVDKCVFKNSEQKMWFRIEIEHNLFAGFCMFDYADRSENTEGNQIDEMDDGLKTEILQYLDLLAINNDDWWINWYYLPTGYNDYRVDYDLIPNFKEMNEAAISLADEGKRKKFVSDSIEVIERKLLCLIK